MFKTSTTQRVVTQSPEPVAYDIGIWQDKN